MTSCLLKRNCVFIAKLQRSCYMSHLPTLSTLPTIPTIPTIPCNGSVITPGAPTLWRYNHGCMTTAIHDFRRTLLHNPKRGLYKGCRKPVLNRVQTGLTVTCCAGCRSTPHTGPCRLLHAPADSSTPIRVSAVALTGFPTIPIHLSPTVCSSSFACLHWCTPLV